MSAADKLAELSTDDRKRVEAAASKEGVEAAALLDFAVYPDKVAIILPSGGKVTYSYADLVGFFQGVVSQVVDVLDGEPAKPTKRPSHTRK